MDMPVIRLRPKGPSQALRFGAPWAYTDTLVMDRRTRNIPPGTIVRLEDENRAHIGTGGFNAASKIGFRMLDRLDGVQINADWLKARIETALSLRTRLYAEPFYRLIHAEADGMPGVVVDRFGDAAVIQPNAAWADLLLPQIADVLASVTGVTTIYKNASGRSRALEGLDDESLFLAGSLDGPVDVPMNGAIYKADITGGQKTGLFFDQRPNHAFAAQLAKGQDILDMFSHVGGFSLAALAAGAASAHAVDASEPALELARAGAAASGFAKQFTTQSGDAFAALDGFEKEARQFGIVVCDPPAFAPAKPALEAGLRAYERVARRAAPLVSQGGYLVLCSCSHAADLAKFREVSLRGVSKAGRRAQILHTGAAGPDHPTHPYLAESSYLKALFLRLN